MHIEHEIAGLMEKYRSRAEERLDALLPRADIRPEELHEAMRYAVLGGGKRIRATLVYLTGAVAGALPEDLDGPACAVELIHAYSLVHDDLPAMDDDELRRGKPTCHRRFGEATAILAGDALQSLAFHVLSDQVPSGEIDPGRCARVLDSIRTLTHAGGSRGMAGGQALDLEAETKTLNLAELENLHIHKTGALIRASVRMGGLAGPDPGDAMLDSLDHYAKCVGLAFQIRDDILDVEGNTEIMGKQRGSDEANFKATYPSLVGLGEAKRMAGELHEEAIASLAGWGEIADPLRWLSKYIIDRVS